MYTTISKDVAESFSETLVERGLAACVNMFKVDSIYRWKGKLEKDEEYLLIIKTSDERLEDLKKYILENHPYELPELIVLDPWMVYEKYGEWVLESCKSSSP